MRLILTALIIITSRATAFLHNSNAAAISDRRRAYIDAKAQLENFDWEDGQKIDLVLNDTSLAELSVRSSVGGSLQKRVHSRASLERQQLEAAESTAESALDDSLAGKLGSDMGENMVKCMSQQLPTPKQYVCASPKRNPLTHSLPCSPTTEITKSVIYPDASESVISIYDIYHTG